MIWDTALSIRGQNKICSKSYAKVERTMNVMQPQDVYYRLINLKRPG